LAAKAAVKKNLSAIKRVRQAEKKNLSNRMARTRLKKCHEGGRDSDQGKQQGRFRKNIENRDKDNKQRKFKGNTA